MPGERQSNSAETLDRALSLNAPVTQLPGVGKKRAALLAKLGVRQVSHLLRHLPMRYEHEAAEARIADLPVDRIGSARGMLVACRAVPGSGGGFGGGRGKQGRFEATLKDGHDNIKLTWFNAPHLQHQLGAGMMIRVQGKVKMWGDYPQITNPRWEKLEADASDPQKQARMRPVYPATQDLPSHVIEQLIQHALPRVRDQIVDPLPRQLIRHNEMPVLADAFAMVHQAEDEDQQKAGRRRLAYNELLLLQLGIAMKRAFVRSRLEASALPHNEAIDGHIRKRFPFELTTGQRQVVDQIADDLANNLPMNRLLQGDVGSGKTVVALYALLMAVADRKQGVVMAPTELLAEQHYLSMTEMLAGSNVNVELLTAGRSTPGSRERAELLERIAQGRVDIVVGTQALATDPVRFLDLAVAVIDEQHRFGVMQRAAFRTSRGAAEEKGQRGKGAKGQRGQKAEEQKAEEQSAKGAKGRRAGNGGMGRHGSAAGEASAELAHAEDAGGKRNAQQTSETAGGQSSAPTKHRAPHHLLMTATPIPRTLSLTIFGDLDVSTIADLPPGRTPIETRVVDEQTSDQVYRYVRQRIDRGEQAFVVVPTIDEEGQNTQQQLKSVHAHATTLQQRYLADRKVDVVHGRLKRSEREQVMERFRRGEIDVLVATTVIEVGVDVPNATVIVIEHAERFGLAQLHQLRGRIGRGQTGRRALCVFIANPTTDESRRRLEAIGSTTNGFKVAEMDLEIRGMGEFFGTRQSGLPPLRVAQIPEDLDLLHLAQRDAQSMIHHDPLLNHDHHQTLRQILMQQYGEALGLIDVG